MKTTQHSFLHDIRIASPCKANWDQMTGDEQVRFCHQCRLNVYNISEMSTQDAENLIIEKEGRVCIRMYRRNDGTLITRDCPVGLAAVKRKLLAVYGGVSSAVACAVMWLLQTQTGVGAVRTTNGSHIMGEVAMPVMGDVAYPSRPVMGKLACPRTQTEMGGIKAPTGVPEVKSVNITSPTPVTLSGLVGGNSKGFP